MSELRSDKAVYTPQLMAEGCILLVREEGAKARPMRVNGKQTCLGRSAAVRVDSPEVEPEHARLELRGGSWVVEALPGAELRINGVKVPKWCALEPGDCISLGKAQVQFFPVVDLAPPVLHPQENGFSRARYFLREALRDAEEDDRDFISTLADLEGAIEQLERGAVLAPAIKLMKEEKWHGALACLDKLLAQQPAHTAALLHRAICLLQLEEYEPCRRAAQQVLKQAGGEAELSEQATAILGQLEQKATLDTALQALKGENYVAAAQAFERLPEKMLQQPQLRLLYCLARAKRLLRQGPLGSLRFAGEKQRIMADLRAVVAAADSQETERNARALLRQLELN